MYAVYTGRRTDGQTAIAFSFLMESGEEVMFSKAPRVAKGWGIGTRFPVENLGGGSWRFDERDGHVTVQPEWVAADRAAQTVVDAKKLKAEGKAGENAALDALTIGQLRALLAESLPDRKRALIALLLQRVGA